MLRSTEIKLIISVGLFRLCAFCRLAKLCKKNRSGVILEPTLDWFSSRKPISVFCTRVSNTVYLPKRTINANFTTSRAASSSIAFVER